MRCETRLKIRATLITTAAVILGVVTVVGAQHLQVYGNSTTNQDSIVWGNVGIGTETPGAPLDIVSGPWNGIHITASGGPADVRLWDSDAATSMAMRFQGSSTTSELQFKRHDPNFGNGQATVVQFDLNSAANSLVLSGSKVGIGTASPAAPLHISNSSGTNVKLGDGNRTLAGGNSAGNMHIDSDAHIYLNHYSTGRVLMATNDISRVGIGTQSPDSKLHVNDDGDDVIRINSTGGTWSGIWMNNYQANKSAALLFGQSYNRMVFARYANGFGSWEANPFMVDMDAPNSSFYMDQYGRLGLGTSSPGYTLHVVGSAAKTTGTAWTSISDRRLKKNIQSLDGALDRLSRLEGRTFEWKNAKGLNAQEGVHMGFVAQEVERVIPEWVSEDAEGHKLINPEGIDALAVEAIKELNAKVERLEAELAAARR